MRHERIFVVPAKPVFDVVDVLVTTAPESMYVVPQVLIDEIVRSAYYDSAPLNDLAGYRAVYDLCAPSMITHSYRDLVDELIAEAASTWRSVLCHHGIEGGDLIEYELHRQSRSIAMRVWLYE
ncbi:hypothetical protein EOM33_04730 [Candidatus Saccharibacteria bacterium]|nr:hypothetical protein [Candidatus Saccharibacteria bacterium]